MDGMKIGKHPYTVLALAVGLTLCLAVPQAQAISIATGELITNGDFGTESSPTLAGWTTSGTANARKPSDNLDDQAGNLGFNNTFLAVTGGFAALGDLEGNMLPPPDSGTHSISQTFTLGTELGGYDIASYDLIVSAYTAFDGRDSLDPSTVHDIFSASLSGNGLSVMLFSQNSSPFPETAPSISNPNSQLVGPFSSVLIGLAPGAYTLTFTLLEDGTLTGETNRTNTAAGIDSVSVTGSGHAVPEPSTMLLLGVGLVGLAGLNRRRTA